MPEPDPTNPPAPAEPPAPPAPPAPEPWKGPASQDELDRIVGERLARERAKFADYDDVKAKAAELDKLREGEKSELQKAQDAAAEETKRRETAENELRQTKVRSAVIAEASKQGAVDPDAVVSLLPQDALTIDDAGQVTNADTAVKNLLTEKPYLLATKHHPANGAGDGGTRGKGAAPQLTRDDLKKMTPQQIVAAEAKGQLNDLVGRT